jgi:hypothetical protein
MAELPANTVAVVDSNSSALGDIAHSIATFLPIGVNLTPISWILLAELLVLGLAGSLFAIRLVQRRRKLMIDAISQMVEHYARRKNAYLELQQKQLEEQFQLSPEKAAQASRQLQENEQAFLSVLTKTLTHWDMRRLSHMHLELEQLSREQLITLASVQGLATAVAATPTDEQDIPSPYEESNEESSPDAYEQPEIKQEQVFATEMASLPDLDQDVVAALNSLEESPLSLGNDDEIPLANPKRSNDDIDLMVPDAGELEIILDEQENSSNWATLPQAIPHDTLELDDDFEEALATLQNSAVDNTHILDLTEEEQAGFKGLGRLNHPTADEPRRQ